MWHIPDSNAGPLSQKSGASANGQFLLVFFLVPFTLVPPHPKKMDCARSLPPPPPDKFIFTLLVISTSG